MREIKFRAVLQNHQRTKMFISEAFEIDSGLWKIFKPESYIGIEEVTTSKKFLLEIPESEQEDGWSLIELVQYTGLKDKNGVCIYEGDILAFEAKEWGTEDDYVFQVEQSETGEWVGAGICTEWKTYCKVIGNIYENPELLKD